MCQQGNLCPHDAQIEKVYLVEELEATEQHDMRLNLQQVPPSFHLCPQSHQPSPKTHHLLHGVGLLPSALQLDMQRCAG